MARIAGGAFRMGSDATTRKSGRRTSSRSMASSSIGTPSPTRISPNSSPPPATSPSPNGRSIRRSIPAPGPRCLSPAAPCFECRADRCGRETCATGGNMSPARTGAIPKGRPARSPDGSGSRSCMSRSRTPPLMRPGPARTCRPRPNGSSPRGRGVLLGRRIHSGRTLDGQHRHLESQFVAFKLRCLQDHDGVLDGRAVCAEHRYCGIRGILGETVAALIPFLEEILGQHMPRRSHFNRDFAGGGLGQAKIAAAGHRPFAEGWANWSNRPFAALQDRPCERAGSARKAVFG